MTNLQPLITQQGFDAAFNVSNNGIELQITEVALGNEGYAPETNDDGQATQTALLSEQQRVPIADGKRIAPQQIDISFIAEGGGDKNSKPYWVKELGFYLADGTLFAVWSDPERALAWKSDTVPLIIALELVLTPLPANAITVQSSNTPLQLLMTRETATLSEAIIRLQREQFQQKLNFSDLQQEQGNVRQIGDLSRAKEQELSAELARLQGLVPKISVHTYYPPEWSYRTTNTNPDIGGDVGLLYAANFSVASKAIIIARAVGHWYSSGSWTHFSMSINGKGSNYGYGSTNKAAVQRTHETGTWRFHHSIMAEVPAGSVKIGIHMGSSNGSTTLNGSSINYTIIETGQ